jgi:hypothetical protein
MIFASVAVVAGIALGLLSAIHQMNVAGYYSVAASPGWLSWQPESQSAWQIYATQRLLDDGSLPPPKTVQLYTRSVDDDGNRLRAECDYSFSTPSIKARWWSIATLHDTSLPAADVLVAGSALVRQDNVIDVNISHQPQGGNWLHTPESGNFIVRIVVNDAVETAHLAGIKKIGC